MIGPHYYRHLDEQESYSDSGLRLKLSLREAAEKIEQMNYGVHRFLSHLVDVRRKELAKRIAEYAARGDHDIAENVRLEGDPLADGIEKLLNGGLY